jgi:hypothetical protein
MRPTPRRIGEDREPIDHDIQPGDYVCSEHDLYRVEHAGSTWAVVEDCRTGELIHMPVSELVVLERVPRRAAAA